MSTLKLISKLEKEYNKLSKKCTRLYKFIKSDKFTELDIDMQHWMLRQNKHMTGYASCLAIRIGLLKHKEQEDIDG